MNQLCAEGFPVRDEDVARLSPLLCPERQREGIDLALSEGRAYGRPKMAIAENSVCVYEQWKAREISAVKAM